MASENQNVCKFFKYGFCKYKTNCKNKHVVEKCDAKNCDIKFCEKRHPRPCKYFVNYGNCKLGSICAYAHENDRKIEKLEQKVEELKNDRKVEMEKLTQKVDELHQIIKNKELLINQLVKDIRNLQTCVTQLGFAYDKTDDEDETDYEDATLEENEVYNEKSAIVRAKDFLETNLEHLDEMETDIKKSKTNLRIKFKNFIDKIEAEIGNFNLVPSDFIMHQQSVHEIFELKDFLTKPESRSDRKDMIEIIDKCRKKCKLLLADVN